MPAGNVSFNSLSGGGYNPNRNTLFFQTDKNKNDDSLGCGMFNFLSEWECIFKYSNNGNPSRIDYSDNLFGQWAAEYQNGRFVGLTKTLTAGYYLYILPCETIETGSVLYGHAKIVVNGNTLFDGDIEWRGSRYGDPNFAYQIKEGDEIQIFWETLPEPKTNTATVIVNSTLHTVRDSEQNFRVYDYVESGDTPDGVYYSSCLQFVGSNATVMSNLPVENEGSGQADANVYSHTYNLAEFPGNNSGLIKLKGSWYGAPFKFTVHINGVEYYNGVINWQDSVSPFTYKYKAGDLIIIDCIRIDEATQEPVVIDNPNKNTLWVQANTYSMFGNEYPSYCDPMYDTGESGSVSLLYLQNTPISTTLYTDLGTTQLRRYPIQASSVGETLVLDPTGTYASNVKRRVVVVVNGTTIYDGITTFEGGGDSDPLFQYIVHDGDEIFVSILALSVSNDPNRYTLVACDNDIDLTVENGNNASDYYENFESAGDNLTFYYIPKGTRLTATNSISHSYHSVCFGTGSNRLVLLGDDSVSQCSLNFITVGDYIEISYQ